ncbi:MAG: sigma-54 dependent transcriptional regulator [Candidatus Marinimicrobia bacterium]|nr:sigma-54 dependent transcriptional regulator [Candidatus Neomarinimicrobiota bacterium]MCF7839455.1 sigma-54 dependent transcriptional regulator [Candidatus Neomarinimicrobiota bacterium]MCF7901869.1 sigma-54 dependent transcriptional regulator [Candidatus Neomarinimicrobiota bacterium]
MDNQKEIRMKRYDTATILAVDDSPDALELLQRNLTSRGYHVFIAEDVQSALKILESTKIDLVLTDLKMPGISGLDLIRHIRENYKNTEVMMITGYATVEGAVEAVKKGAEEYLAKPFTDHELFTAVERSLDKLHLRRSEGVFPDLFKDSFYGLIGQSSAMKRVFRTISKAADTTATVLITGESGTGKELVARAIHYSGRRRSASFVAVNCGGIPESLLESELFGYMKGAFTGATSTRAGFFQTADGGTIFLDEISEATVSMQVKLLRVLQSKEVCMVGSTKTQQVDVRIIAATNKDLQELVKLGLFREDLYFRLNIINIGIPPLRERGEDTLLLVKYFMAKYRRELGSPEVVFADEVLEALKKYRWPGNVREMENTIQRLILMSDNERVEMSDLPGYMRFSVIRERGYNRTIAEVEAEHIRGVLMNVAGNKSRAAGILGIDRKTLREKMKRYGIE